MIPKRKYAIIALALSLLLCAIICVVVVMTKSPSKDQAKLTGYPVEVIRVVLLRTLCLLGGGINCIVNF